MNLILICSVVGMSDTNIALGKLALMSSLWRKQASLLATRGNDGNYSSNFHTARGNKAWWAVDLGQGDDQISRVKITNIEERSKLSV